MAKSRDDKIAALQARKEKVAAQLNAEMTKAKEEDRKRLARRKTVVGGAILGAIESDDSLAEIVARALAINVTSPTDREVIADLLERPRTKSGEAKGDANDSRAA